MKIALLLITAFCFAAKAADPATLMTTRGKLLASDDFVAAPAPFTGKPVGFASGFSGWRYNSSATGGKGGRWEIANGEFRGIETPGANHPATASFGLTFQDVIIQCEVRLNDVPDEGRKYRSLFVKATDAKDYVISLSVGQGGLFLTPYDADKINPATKQRDKGPVSRVLTPIKLNAVVVRGYNEDDVVDLARLTLDHPWQVRFIEMMPFGGISEFQLSHSVPEQELRDRIAAALGPLELCHEGRLDGEAKVYRLAGAPGTLGFISPVSQPFCAGCNRARLMADGMLRLCLLRERELDLRGPLRSGLERGALKKLMDDHIYLKPWGHGLAAHQFATNRTMSEIGG